MERDNIAYSETARKAAVEAERQREGGAAARFTGASNEISLSGGGVEGRADLPRSLGTPATRSLGERVVQMSCRGWSETEPASAPRSWAVFGPHDVQSARPTGLWSSRSYRRLGSSSDSKFPADGPRNDGVGGSSPPVGSSGSLAVAGLLFVLTTARHRHLPGVGAGHVTRVNGESAAGSGPA